MSNPHTVKNLSQHEIDAISRILRDRKIKDYEAQFGMTSEAFLKLWNAGQAEVTFATNHWARLLAQEAPLPLVANEPPIDEYDTRPVDTSGNSEEE